MNWRIYSKRFRSYPPHVRTMVVTPVFHEHAASHSHERKQDFPFKTLYECPSFNIIKVLPHVRAIYEVPADVSTTTAFGHLSG
jgi:hypothetical protein